jgi:nucleotide-binding universal stress UspA family protein
MSVSFKKIACTTDMSDFSNYTLAYGVALARQFGAKLYACHVISLPSMATYYGYSTDDSTGKVTDRITRQVMEMFEKTLDPVSTDWESVITIGHISDEIFRLTEEKKIDLVVAATHGRSGLKRFLLGSVTERLMHILPCPLLIIGGPEEKVNPSAGEGLTFSRILVGCDFSSDSEAAFQYGLSLAQEYQAELHLVHVIEPPVYIDIDMPGTLVGPENMQTLRDRLNAKMSALVPSEARHWCRPRISLLEGLAYEVLIQYARQNNIDLVVLGARGYSLVEKLFIGSTTDRVVRRTPCPVLSVRQTPVAA